MKYLLDVNALIAIGIKQHQFHSRVESWLVSLAPRSIPKFATCSITELGFVRVASQVSAYGFTLEQAKLELVRLKQSNSYDFQFLSDGNDISHLPAWVKAGKHTTDGHLTQLAKSHGAILATLDENIPGSFVIPIN
jgi:predicted nucleic acid-binding protein